MSAIKPPAKLLEEAIAQIRSRRSEILTELRDIDDALRRVGIDGTQLANANGRTLVQGGRGHAPVTAPTKPGKRTRRAAPSMEWLTEALRDGKKSQPELARQASNDGYSDTAVATQLKKHSGQFKSERAPRVPGIRGNPALIWSLRTA